MFSLLYNKYYTEITIMKKILIFFSMITFLSITCITSYAYDPQDIVDDIDISGTPSTHVYTLTSNYTTNESDQIRLNAYTWGTPVAGTPVTTWRNDNSATQKWGYYEIAGMGDEDANTQGALASLANMQLVLQITRTSAEPEATLYYLSGNRYGDVILNKNSSNTRYYFVPRYIHSHNMYLTAAGSLSGSNGGTYLKWAPSGTTFYTYDISLHTY